MSPCPHNILFRQTCGGSLERYRNRMDAAWEVQEAYQQARKLLRTQDDFCSRIERGLWTTSDGPFPTNARLDTLIGAMRGSVKV